MRNRACNVINVPGDADVDIVKTTVDVSHRHSTTLIGKDTDLLIFLLHYADTNPGIKDLYFHSVKTFNHGTQHQRLKAIIGPDTGCDSTSRIFGIGKKTGFKKLMKGKPIIK